MLLRITTVSDKIILATNITTTTNTISADINVKFT
jgi:hypothetical protein